MERRLSLRELRQNPTRAIDALEEGDTVVITRRNRPVADLVPHIRRSGATPGEFLALLRMAPVDAEWAHELTAHRRAESRDVWGDD